MLMWFLCDTRSLYWVEPGGRSANLSGYDINTTCIVNDGVMDRLTLPKIALTCQNIREGL